MALQVEGAQMCAPIFPSTRCRSTLDTWEMPSLLARRLPCQPALQRGAQGFPCSHCPAPAQKPKPPTLSSNPITGPGSGFAGVIRSCSYHDFCNTSHQQQPSASLLLQGGEAPWGTQGAVWPKPTVRSESIAMCCRDISHHSRKNKNWC